MSPNQRRGRTISLSARGAKPLTHHGPLQRLLGALIRWRRRRSDVSRNEDRWPRRQRASRAERIPPPPLSGRSGQREICAPLRLYTFSSIYRKEAETENSVPLAHLQAPQLIRLEGWQVAQDWAPNGEVEGPDDASGRTQVERSSPGAPDAAERAPRAHNLLQRPRRQAAGASRPPRTIVRSHLHRPTLCACGPSAASSGGVRG